MLPDRLSDFHGHQYFSNHHFLWGLKLKLTGFSRYNFNIVTVNTFRSSPGGKGGGRLPPPIVSTEGEPSERPMRSHYPPPLLRLNSPVLQMPATGARPHPASYSQCVLMNASIFLFCTTTVISEINASCLWLLNLLHVGQLTVGGKTGLGRAKRGAIWDRSQLNLQQATGPWAGHCSPSLSFSSVI